MQLSKIDIEHNTLSGVDKRFGLNTVVMQPTSPAILCLLLQIYRIIRNFAQILQYKIYEPN
jgi:hypothetical protein